MSLNILAIGVHPDDIEIPLFHCGGMLIKAVRNGHSVYLYNITQGEKAGDPRQRAAELRRTATDFLTPNYLLRAI